MVTPDNTLGQGVNEQARIEIFTQEIKNAANSMGTLRDKFNAIKISADQVEKEMDNRVKKSVSQEDELLLRKPLSGNFGDESTIKHHALSTNIIVKETLRAFKINPNLISEVPSPIGRSVIDKLTSKILTPDIEIDSQSAPYIYKLMHRAINNQLIDVDSLALAFAETQYLVFYNESLLQIIQKSLIEIAVDQGLTEERAKKIFKYKDEGIDSRENALSYSDAILYNKLGDKDKPFFNSLNSAQSFKKYCLELQEEIKRTDKDFIQATNAEKENILRIKLSEKIKQRTTSTVYKIYEHILHERKNEAIEHLEQEGGIYNSVSVLYSGFRQKIEALMADVEHSGKDFDIQFVAPKRVEENTYDPKTKQFERIQRILPDYERIHEPKDFLEFIMREIDSERTRIRYGFNLEYIMRTGAIKPEDGLMKSIAGYATNLRSDQIDEIFIEETGKVVQTAITLFDQRNEKYFAFSNWRSDPGHMDEYFSNIDKMKEHVEKYIRIQYKDKYEDWMIERAIFNAKLVIYGMYFKPMLWYSYADPKVTESGGPTYRGEGEMGLAVFDPGHLGKRFHQIEPGKHIGAELVTKGADFMPINQVIENYKYQDWEVYYKAWKDSFKKGKAAFYDVAKEDCFDLKLFIDIGNTTVCGGVDTLSGWRIFSAYKDWIRDYLDVSEDIKYSKDDNQTLVYMWKNLENIGLDTLENFTDKFITGKIPSKKDFKDFSKKEEQLKAFKGFYEFLYDRYFAKGIGNHFLINEEGKKITKNEYLNNISDLLENKDYNKQERLGDLKGWIYKAFSTMLFERMPLKYVLLEKQRLTQNGVTLLSELQDFANVKGWSIQDFEQTIDDLILAQTELRLNVSDDMDRIEKRLTRNVYGDLTKSESEVNEGLGYVLDENGIERILKNAGKDEKRIDRVKTCYAKLKELIVAEKPGEADWENIDRLKEKLKHEKNPKEIESLNKEIKNIKELQKLYTSRLTWFYEMYKDNKFGFSVTSGELALKFISLSASGPDTIKRAANYSANTGEALTRYWGGMLTALREARQKKDTSGLYPELLKLYTSIESEMGPGNGPNSVIAQLLKKTTYFFRKNKIIPGMGSLSDLKDWALRQPSSFAEEDAGEPGKLGAYELDVNGIHKLISQFQGDLGRSLIPEHPEEPLMSKRVSKKHGFIGKLVEKITNKKIYQRDWANEISGQALKHFHRSEASQFFWQTINPKFWLALLAILILLGYKSFKSDFVVGASSK